MPPRGGLVSSKKIMYRMAGDNGTAGEPYTSQCQGFCMDETVLGGIPSGNVAILLAPPPTQRYFTGTVAEGV